MATTGYGQVDFGWSPTVLLVPRSEAFIPSGSPFGGNYFRDGRLVPHFEDVFLYYWDISTALHQRPEQRVLLTLLLVAQRRVTSLGGLLVRSPVQTLALLHLVREGCFSLFRETERRKPTSQVGKWAFFLPQQHNHWVASYARLSREISCLGFLSPDQLKLLPHPQVDEAFGLTTSKPLWSISS